MRGRSTTLPKYRKHKASGQAIVTLDGKMLYLGPHGTKASHVEYDRLIQEWLAHGRMLPSKIESNPISVVELCAEYWKFAKEYYVKDGKQTDEIASLRVALRFIRETYRSLEARVLTKIVDYVATFIHDMLLRMRHRTRKFQDILRWPTMELRIGKTIS